MGKENSEIWNNHAVWLMGKSANGIKTNKIVKGR